MQSLGIECHKVVEIITNSQAFITTASCNMIHTQQLTYRYPQGAGLAFDDVSVPQGGVLVLRGNSGSGKSTLLALAAGLLTAANGQIEIAGQNPAVLKAAQRDAWRGRTVGFLPQRLHLSDALTVFDNLALAYFAVAQPVDKAHIMHSLDALGVASLAARKPHALSGGQAQRVALARALLMQPKVILADEPTASLDDNAAQSAITLLAQAAQRCTATLVVATHDARVQTALEGSFIDKSSLQPKYLLLKQL
jgi:putative ABC transport system ATP-binding protein